MADATPNTPPPVPASKLVRIFMCTNLCYLIVVHTWMFGLHSLGQVYADTFHIPWGYRHFLQAQMSLFGTWTPAYHFVNLVLLYGCMVSLFFFTWHLLRGPVWFGSLAATLMMAHPMKTEAVLQASGGASSLLPAFFALLSLAFYSAHLRWGRQRHLLLAFSAFALLTPSPAVQLGVLGVIVLMDVSIPPKVCNRWRPFPFAALSILAQFLANAGSLGWDWKNTATTLFLTVYPFGLQAETQARMTDTPLFMHAATLFGVALVTTLGLLVQNRAYWVALAGALAYMTLSGDSAVDWAHFVGGGTKILPISLVAVAFCAVVQRMFDAGEWRRPLVLATAVLCLFFFGLQFREISHWRFAAQEARKQVALLNELEREDGLYVVVPQFGYYHTAPMEHSNYLTDPAMGFPKPEVDAFLVYQGFQRGKSYRLKLGNGGPLRLYLSDVNGMEMEVPLKRMITYHHSINGIWHDADKLQVASPYAIQENGEWVLHTPKTWMQRLREWEMQGKSRVE